MKRADLEAWLVSGPHFCATIFGGAHQDRQDRLGACRSTEQRAKNNLSKPLRPGTTQATCAICPAGKPASQPAVHSFGRLFVGKLSSGALRNLRQNRATFFARSMSGVSSERELRVSIDFEDKTKEMQHQLCIISTRLRKRKSPWKSRVA